VVGAPTLPYPDDETRVEHCGATPITGLPNMGKYRVCLKSRRDSITDHHGLPPPPSQPDQGILEGLTNPRQREGLLASASGDGGRFFTTIPTRPGHPGRVDQPASAGRSARFGEWG